MGYYFEFEIHATLKRDTQKEVLDTIMREIYGVYLENYPEHFTKMTAYSLKDIYIQKVINAEPDYSNKFWNILRSRDIFSWFIDKTHPYLQPRWKDHDKFKNDPENYQPIWHLRLIGDLSHSYDAINGFVEYITPYLAGHKPKQYIGWYKGEDQNERINLYAIRPVNSKQKQHDK